LGGSDAMMIPKTEDGRILFGVPWEGKLLVGTTDTPLDSHSAEPRALASEVSFILRTAGQYLSSPPAASDVLSVFAGLRPLAAPRNGDTSTKEISRSHKIIRSPSGLVTITGGKWTTYRRMAQDTVDAVIKVAGLEPRRCVTASLPIHGSPAVAAPPAATPPGDALPGYLALYGTDGPLIEALAAENPSWAKPLNPRLPFTGAQVIWAVRQEGALTVEDVLARRIRALFLDARASIEMVGPVAALMAGELGRDGRWETEQLEAFTALAKGYLL
jgi:glycerol-3-phosphate dehydrogenase